MILADANQHTPKGKDHDGEGTPGYKPVIIFAIIIGGVFGCFLLSLVSYFFYRLATRKKNSLIRMNNEIYQKHPLTVKGQVAGLDVAKQTDMQGLNLANARLSNMLVSTENLRKLEEQQLQQKIMAEKGYDMNGSRHY